MYEGFNKGDGSVVASGSAGCSHPRDGRLRGEEEGRREDDGCEGTELGELYDCTAAEESLMCLDQDGEELTLTARIGPESGELVWARTDTGEVLKRTLSMSQMTSMLRDADRNKCYEDAIAKLMDNFRRVHGRAPVVLDIGAGTGLLSMLCVKHGAEFAFAAEMFDALATVAERVVADNGLEDRVMVIHARSSDIDALPVPPDIVVSELIDSSLLGEGCLPAHFDAIDRLLSADRTGLRDRVLPYSATVHATLISSVEVQRMHAVSEIKLAGDVKLCRPQDTATCPGGRGLVPVHWAEMKQRGGSSSSSSRELSAAEPVLSIPFHPADGSDDEFSELGRCYDTEVSVSETGVLHGILLHWTLYLLSPALDPERQLCYSSSPGAQNWQDHWQPCVYALPAAIAVDVGDIVTIRSSFNAEKVTAFVSKVVKAADGRKRPRSSGSSDTSHRVLSAIAVTVAEEEEEETAVAAPADCTCGWHLLCGGERFQAMCDPYRAARWQLALDKMIAQVRAVLRCDGQQLSGQQLSGQQDQDPTTPPSASTPRPPPYLIIDASDGSLLSISTAVKINRAADISVDELLVVSKESKLFSRMFFQQLSQANGVDDGRLLLWDGQLQLSDVVVVDYDDDDDDEPSAVDYDLKAAINGKVVAVISECYYYQLRAFPRMQALSFYYYRASLHRQGLLHPRCITVPARGFVRAAAVELRHLYACHGPVDHASSSSSAAAACGLDHAAFNCEVRDWHSHWYPYKLADYQKRLLCEPLTLCTLDFENPNFSLPSEGHLSSSSIVTAGRCDAVAVWMDYCLLDTCDLSMPTDPSRGGGEGGEGASSSVLSELPHYLVANLKFFPIAIPVKQEQEFRLTCRTKFQFGDPDFTFDFRLEGGQQQQVDSMDAGLPVREIGVLDDERI